MPNLHETANAHHYHAYLTGSKTAVSLLMLHGFTGSSENWRPFFPQLTPHFHTIAVDILGHGQTAVPADPDHYRIEAVAQDLITLLDQLEIDKAHLLGYSMGGRLALATAVLHPHRFHTLTLESASPGLADPVARQQRTASDNALADFIEREGIEAFVDRWEKVPIFASQQQLPQHIRTALRQQRLQNQPLGLANSLRGMGTGQQPSFWDALPTLTLPVHLIVGQLDQKFVTINQQMAAQLPNAQLTIVPSSGHTVHLEQPDQFVSQLLKGLRG